MVRHFAGVGGLAVVAGLLAAPAAQASTHFSVQIGVGVPGPVIVAPAPVYGPAPVYAPAQVYAGAPGPGYVWTPGYYVTTRFGSRWVPGGWVLGNGYGRPGWDRERWEERERWNERERWGNERWDREHRDRYREDDRREWRR
jgi:hypothetical protein